MLTVILIAPSSSISNESRTLRMKITVKAKVTDDSKNKLGKIESEFQNYQLYLQSGCTGIVNLYSATKQQAQRALKKI
jgi:hypothetical protein